MTTTDEPTSPICHIRHSRKFAGVYARYTWDPKTGTRVSFEGETATPSHRRNDYVNWVSAAFVTANRIDVQMQESSLDLPGLGLQPFLIEEEDSVGWVSRDIELAFATPYVTRDPASAGDHRIHSTFTLRLWGVPHYGVCSAQWNDTEAMSALLHKMQNPDAILVEVALTNNSIIEQARRQYEAEEAAHHISQILTRADHVPYTRVAKKIKEATRGGVASRVYPIAFPGAQHVPAVAVTRFRFNEASVRRALEDDGFTCLTTPSNDSNSRRSTDHQIWVKQPSLFPAGSPQVDWLESEAREVTRYYSGSRYASA